MLGLRTPELLLILLVVVVLLGAKKLPQLGSGLGSAVRSFRSALGGATKELDPPPDA